MNDTQMTPTQEVRYLRAKEASRSVKIGAAVGAPGSIVSSYIALRLASKYGIPVDVVAVALGGVVTGWHTLAAYLTRGGRKGEAD